MIIAEYHLNLFYKYCDPAEENACWNWLGSKDSSGYGKLGTGNNILSAHRVAYTLYKGEIPEGLYVLHTCDNPACTNPKHLYAGTQKQNKQDSVAKNRHHKPKGSLNGNARLNEAIVKEIKEQLKREIDINKIAHTFSVSQGTIYNIKAGISWRHVSA